jgi:hypothetical protein
MPIFESGALISVYRQWIARFYQAIVMIGESCYKYVTKIRLYSADSAGGGGTKLFSVPIFTMIPLMKYAVTFGHHNTIQVLLREMPGIFSCNNIEK